MIQELDAVILCGGQGRRLQSVVSDKPKVLADINGEPFLDILITHLKNQGLRRIILCTGYKADHIEEYYLRNSKEMTFEFSREVSPLGTGGALKNAQYLIQSDPFFVFNGDSFCAVNLKAFLDFHSSKLARASIVVSPKEETSSFGQIILDDWKKITGFREKELTLGEHYVNAGIYCLDEDTFSLMPDEKQFSLEYDFFPLLVDKGFYGFAVSKEFFDIGTPARYELAKQALKGS